MAGREEGYLSLNMARKFRKKSLCVLWLQYLVGVSALNAEWGLHRTTKSQKVWAGRDPKALPVPFSSGTSHHRPGLWIVNNTPVGLIYFHLFTFHTCVVLSLISLSSSIPVHSWHLHRPVPGVPQLCPPQPSPGLNLVAVGSRIQSGEGSRELDTGAGVSSGLLGQHSFPCLPLGLPIPSYSISKTCLVCFLCLKNTKKTPNAASPRCREIIRLIMIRVVSDFKNKAQLFLFLLGFYEAFIGFYEA